MKTYSIKPLVWWRGSNDEGWTATTIMGFYQCWKFGDVWRVFNRESMRSELYDSAEAAKLAAEEWYIEQIEQALEPQGE